VRQHRADGEPGVADALVRAGVVRVGQFECESPAAGFRQDLADAVRQCGEQEQADGDGGGRGCGEGIEQAGQDEQHARMCHGPTGRGDVPGSTCGADLEQRDDECVERQHNRHGRRRRPGVAGNPQWYADGQHAELDAHDRVERGDGEVSAVAQRRTARDGAGALRLTSGRPPQAGESALRHGRSQDEHRA